MKLKKRLLSLAMLCVAWVGSAWADTTLLTEANGWQKVTDLSTLTLSDYYFAFVDNDKDLMLSFEEAPSQSTDPSFCTMVYRTGARAELKHTMLWILEENPSTSGAHLIKSAYYNDKFLQTEDQAAWYCRTHDNGGGTGYSWGAWKFAYADSKWSIENGTYSGNYVGPWDAGAFQNGMQVAGNKTGNNVGYFQIYAIPRTTADGWQANASKDNPADITFKITNPRAVSNANGWTAGGTNSSFGRKGGSGTFTGLAGFFEPSNWGASNYNITVTQTINDLPAGKYKVRAAGQNSSGNTLTLDCGGEAFTYQATGTSNGKIDKTGAVVAAGSGVAGWEWGEAYHTLSATGSLTITLHSSASTEHQWANYDNVELYYYGNGVELEAEAKNAGEQFTTVAGQWYVIPVATDGDYVFTVGDGSNVTYTQKGNTPESGTFSTATSSVAYSLTKGYVYLKTETATNVNFDASSYTYTVGEATADVSCIQPGKTVTISYNKAVTNDPNATFEKLGTVTFNGTTITPVLSGTSFTFTVPEGLETSKAYTLSIPAGAFGYDGGATCSAQEITFNTPAVFDGRYYLYNNYDQKYFSRGGNWGTQACVDEYGIAVILTTDENNATSVKMFDSYMNIGLDGWVYTDCQGGNVRYFNISQVEGGYKLLNTNNSKYLATNGGHVVADAVEGDNLVGTSNIWTIEDVNSHLAVLKANDDKQAKAVAEAAGLTAETKVALETILAGEEYEARPITVTGTSGIQENYQGGSSGNIDSKPLDIFKETVTGLKPGIYKLSVNAFQRATWLEDVCNAGGARGKVYVYANDNKTQLKSIAEEPATEAYTGGKEVDGKYYPDNLSSAGVAFDKGMYVNDVYVYVTGNELTFGIQNPTRMGNDGSRGAWTAYRNFTLTYYAVANLETYYNDLSTALLKYKPWTETGEYVTKYNEFSAACQNKTYETKDEINDAISYLQTNYPTYAWDNANMEHPYLVEGVISRSDCTTNGDQDPYTDWAGSGRRMTSGQHWSGDASRQYFRDVVDGAARSQTVIIPKVGTYLLKASVRVIDDNSYAIISVGDESVERREKTGSTGGTIAIDGTEYESVEAGKAAGATFANSNNGFGWIYNKLIFCTSSENEEKKISINLSHAEATPTRIAECGGMFLYYIGQNYDKIEGNTHYYYGSYATAPSFEVTEAVPVVDATKASVTGATVTLTNPNGLVYLASGSTASGNNVVVDGTCANLVLTDGHPFKATKQFTATKASYNMTAVAGDKFGTLMLPFAVTTLPGKAYSLDQGVTYGGDIYATEVNAIAANSPVLVTATGAYTATEASVAATADTYTNGELVGTYKAMPAEENTFVLQKHDDYVAFFMVKDTKPTVNPFRAYIKAQSGAASKEFVNVIFDSNTTGISNVNNQGNAANDIIYDLSGRRVNKAHKGVYIINGKKIIK